MPDLNNSCSAFFIMKTLLIILIIISGSQIYSKNLLNNFSQKTYLNFLQDSLNTQINNNNENSNKKLILENPFYYNLQKTLPQDFFFPGLNSNFSYSQSLIPGIDNNENSLRQAKLQLSKAMQMNYSFIKKNELGTFGKILGAAVGATAVGLGVYHIIKYKDEYFK
ncbi:MAG: hypothetical protein A2068_11165 [Ignavibacteria bacterium GWB2_35_6b]|nr:MAG: hypothetical protein A2068_11165 [Ignavibacteria bacterium GWB2_35_6b]